MTLVHRNHKPRALAALVAACTMAIGIFGAASAAYGNPNPHNNSCQSAEAAPGGGTPGNAATSPGSVFNEPLINSPDGGKGGIAYNKAHANNKVGATSQYDTACVKVSANGTGTPMQTAPVPLTDVPNNSIATRTADGVISHTGNG